MKHVVIIGGALLAVCVGTIPALAGEAVTDPVAAAERKVVASSLAIIRGCQSDEGWFNQVNHGQAAGSQVWIAPYFVNYAVLALEAECERTKDKADLERVRKWLAWCAAHQESDGYWFDHTGTVGSYKSNGMIDAWDSSAAMYLVVLERFRRLGGKVSPEMAAAAKKSFACIRAVTDADGLTWAKPDYKVKYLMDNVEVFAGVKSASTYFEKTGEKALAAVASEQADKIAARLPTYWRPERKLFAWALHPNGAFDVGLDKEYPHGLAQLFGLAFVAAEPECWNAVREKFPKRQQGPAAASGVERWAAAAARFPRKDATEWRAKMVEEARAFTPSNVYVYRPALVVLVLLEGADWMPSVRDAERARRLPKSNGLEGR